MSRSSFPDKVDEFLELFDLPADKIVSANRLVELKGKTQLNNAEQAEIKALTAELQDYMITPETWNKLADCIVNLETFFDSEVRGYIADKQDEWDTYVDDFNYVGDWQATGKYKRQNLLTYLGDLYFVLKDVVADSNHTPDKTSTVYKQVAFKGDKGDIGLNAFYKGEWSGTTAYEVGDAVAVRLGDDWNPLEMVFICKKAHTGQKPDIAQGSDYWFPYNQIMIGTTKPNNLHPTINFIKLLD